MEAGSLLHLPRSLKRAIAATLLIGFTLSGFLLVLTLVRGSSNSPLLESAVSLFQFLATGSALAIIAFYSSKNIGTDELLTQTSQFLIEEMPRAFKASLISRPFDESDWSITQAIGDVSTAVVQIDHVHGTPSAAYSIAAMGSKLKLRITLNAFRFVVLYYIPRLEHSEQDVEKAIDLVIAGAKSVDYTYRIATNPSMGKHSSYVEVYFYRTTERDLLLDSSSRLFWSQDIAVMTKSMLLQLQRAGISLAYEQPRAAA